VAEMEWPSAAGRRAIEVCSSRREVPLKNNPPAAQTQQFDFIVLDPATFIAARFGLTRPHAELAGITGGAR
jgi:hypothetical protein